MEMIAVLWTMMKWTWSLALVRQSALVREMRKNAVDVEAAAEAQDNSDNETLLNLF
jgi:hypothetical protein